MAKTKFNIITSTCVPLPLENVDTDQIIPARFLKATTREEKFFGDNLFRDWRYNADGSLNKDFVLLPVVVTEGFLQELFDSIYADPKMEVEVNLPEQTITNKATGKSEHFEINAYKKLCLMNGLDDIDFLLSNKNKIEEWENKASK